VTSFGVYQDPIFAHAYTHIHAFQNGILTQKNCTINYPKIYAVGRKSIVSIVTLEQTGELLENCVECPVGFHDDSVVTNMLVVTHYDVL